MMCSYIVEAKSEGHEVLNGKVPSIFEIQEHIETAWDCGINANGRVETGGIRGTRKYIGTPDVSCFNYRGISYLDSAAILTSCCFRHKQCSCF